MTDDKDNIRKVEGTHEPPVFDPRPVDPDDDPYDVIIDPGADDMPDDLPPGSYEADRHDHHGTDDHPRDAPSPAATWPKDWDK